jgi:sterol desaturase/sphingolipid hydroxylase (fatty acid hydroxylase superfamily)
MTALFDLLTAAVAGALLWTFAEYMLHRFAMHELRGRGMMSREHLEHHVRATWTFDPVVLLSWLGVLVVGAGVWGPLGWLVAGPAVGIGLGAGWVLGYGFYELQHALAHLRAPGTRYAAWLRRHHFHHHFGHPMANHGVTTAVWDRVFGTLEVPERVRVPRRLVLPWLVDEHGAIRPEFAADYELVGDDRADERLAAIDRARAFASIAPVD